MTRDRSSSPARPHRVHLGVVACLVAVFAARDRVDTTELVLDTRFREKVAAFYSEFRRKRACRQFSAAVSYDAASDLTLLAKYLAGRLPASDFELDFGVKGTPANMLQTLLARLAEAVARNYFRLLAYKDEYEVARLHSDTAFRSKIASQFEGDYKLNFYLAPPLLSETDPNTGHPIKRRFGPWMMSAFSLLAKAKGLRGTPLDVFGRTPERRMERQLIGEYEALVDELLARLERGNHAVALQLAALPEEIRGFGYIKENNLKTARAKWSELLARFRGQQAAQVIRMPSKVA